MEPEQIIVKTLAQGRRALDEASAKQLLMCFGLPVPKSLVARDAADAVIKARGLTPPLVVKVVSPDILHKSDAGGVRLGLRGGEETSRAIQEMCALPAISGKRIEGWLIEEMAAEGQEIVIGGVRNGQFGPLVMVGLGGILVEVLQDVSFRLCPIDEVDARAMIAELGGAAVLDGMRGGPRLDSEALVDALLRVGGADGLMMRIDAVAELDINPLILRHRGLTAVDARVILEDSATPSGRADPGPRRPRHLPVLEWFRPLFEPRTIAVLGASAKGGTLANTFIRRMKAFGYPGEIYPIHPEAAEVEGLPTFKSIATAPQPIDYAFIALAAARVPTLLEEGHGRLRFAQVISSGFGEIEGGQELERELVAKARAAGANVIGPNCLGTYSPRGGLTFSENAPKDLGTIAIISQSGGLTTNMMRRGEIKGLRYSAAITAGNCADIGPADLLEYFLADPQTKAIGCYLEDAKHGRALFELLRTSRKPVVLLRGGKSRQGELAAASHTGALAGDGRAWKALAAQTPTVEVETLDEFIDGLLALQYLELRPERPTTEVVMFGNGGGSSVLGADFFASRGLQVSSFAAHLRGQLEKLDLLPGSSVANPIDTPVATLQQNEGRVAGQILDLVYEHARPDAIAMHLNMSSFAGRGGIDPVDQIFAVLERAIELRSAAHVLLAFRTDGDRQLEERKSAYREMAGRLHIPMYDEIPELAKALAAVAHLERRLAMVRSRHD